MATMNNLEKLIQMATLEQMYIMLEKLRANNINNYKDFNFSDVKIPTTNNENNINQIFIFEEQIKNLQNELYKININFENENKELKNAIHNMNDKLKTNNDTINKLLIKINELEEELNNIKNNTNHTNDTNFLYQQIKGQQSLKNYPGFFTKDTKDDAHIELKIEEKTQNENEVVFNNKQEITIGSTISLDITNDLLELDINNDDEEKEYKEDDNEEDDNEEDEEPVEILEHIKKECKLIVVDENESDKEKEEDESDEEEEVGTEDELESLGENEVSNEEEVEKVVEEKRVEKVVEEKGVVKEEEDKEDEQEEEEEVIEKEEEQEEEEQEEEEEVFEIEIDDVTYFATDEENGILYEMTEDGDIGKKVGIIKDGEPIFN